MPFGVGIPVRPSSTPYLTPKKKTVRVAKKKRLGLVKYNFYSYLYILVLVSILNKL